MRAPERRLSECEGFRLREDGPVSWDLGHCVAGTAQGEVHKLEDELNAAQQRVRTVEEELEAARVINRELMARLNS